MARIALAFLAAFIWVSPAFSDLIVYNNTTTPLPGNHLFYDSSGSSNGQVGDELILAGTERTLTSFSTSIRASLPVFTTTSADLTLRFFTGPGTPSIGTAIGSPITNVGVPLVSLGNGTITVPVTFAVPGYTASTDLIWTLSASNVGAPVSLLSIFTADPPTVGSSNATFIWGNFNNGGFFHFGSGNNLNAMVLVADPSPVPEPSSLILCAAGAAGMLGYRYKSRRGRTGMNT